MGSISNPNSSPYYNFLPIPDCSQPICTANCPQWCYIVFPPPPSSSEEDDGATKFPPLIVALIGILTAAFLLVSYYTIISKYCKQTRRIRRTESNNPDPISPQNSGIDEAIIKSITVYKYSGDGDEDGFISGGTECAVCLSEFEKDEDLRVLPKCSHAFHLNCIDTWLKSHTNCPLCRANVVSVQNPVVELDRNMGDSSSGSDSGTDLILVVVVDGSESVGGVGINGGIRRSVSFQGVVRVSDVVLMNDEEIMGMGIEEQRDNNGGESANVLRRSVSAGRFVFTRHNKRSF